MDLKAKLEKELTDNKEININPATINQVAKEDTKVEAPDAAMDKTTTVKLSDRVKNDPALKTAEAGSVADAMTAEQVKIKTAADIQNKIMVDLLSIKDNIEITSKEKHAFLDSLINNTKFTGSFSLFGGTFTGEFRTRTQLETFAIFQQLNKELRKGGLESQLSYSMRLRNMLFAAQIKRLNDKEFVELKEPLITVVDGDKETPPAWLDQITYWDKLNDGVINVIYSELRKFEYKYLMMLENANTQNFWKAELPI